MMLSFTAREWCVIGDQSGEQATIGPPYQITGADDSADHAHFCLMLVGWPPLALCPSYFWKMEQSSRHVLARPPVGSGGCVEEHTSISLQYFT